MKERWQTLTHSIFLLVSLSSLTSSVIFSIINNVFILLLFEKKQETSLFVGHLNIWYKDPKEAFKALFSLLGSKKTYLTVHKVASEIAEEKKKTATENKWIHSLHSKMGVLPYLSKPLPKCANTELISSEATWGAELELIIF